MLDDNRILGDGPPITKRVIDEYRARVKADPNEEARFNYARFLIDAAKRVSVGDDKSSKKYRDALLDESVKMIRKLATPTSSRPAYADAQFFYATCLGEATLGLQVDHEKAYNLYVQASKQNHPAATYRTGVCNEVGAGTKKDPDMAVIYYRKASALGDTAAMFKLGMILLNGLLGQRPNPPEAINLLRKAASQADEDNPHALHELGVLHEKNPTPLTIKDYVHYDPERATAYFSQAAMLGYAPSQHKLGSLYEEGRLNLPLDPMTSIAWYTRAAEQGHADAELSLSGWYLTGAENVLIQSDHEAYLWALRAANRGHANAQFAVGYYHDQGIGTPRDPIAAHRWYSLSARAGNARARQRLMDLEKDPSIAMAKPSRSQNDCIIM